MAYNYKEFTFADGSKEIRLYSTAIGLRDKKKVKHKYIVSDDYKAIRSKQESIKRTERKLEILARANKWQYFVTLTFNDKYVDAYNYDDCVDKMKLWLNNISHKYKGCKYLLVFERGKKTGRLHCHALFSDCPFKLKPYKYIRGHQVYTIQELDYKYGFSNCSKVIDTGACSRYISKYIGKALGEVPPNAKRYWATRNLITEEDITHKLLIDEYQKKNLKDSLSANVDVHIHDVYVADIDLLITYINIYAPKKSSGKGEK